MNTRDRAELLRVSTALFAARLTNGEVLRQLSPKGLLASIEATVDLAETLIVSVEKAIAAAQPESPPVSK